MEQETLEQKTIGRKKASDFPQELINLLDHYVHGRIDRRGFLDGAQKFAVGGVTATALFEMLKPNYAWAVQVPTDDKRIKSETVTVPSPKGNGSIKGYFVKPANATGKLPVVLVIHENRGLNPYIEDVARRLAVANFIAYAPDGLTSLGGYPGDEEKAVALFPKVDPAKMREDFVASAEWLKARPDSTGKLGIVGFCFGGTTANALAVRLGSEVCRGGSVLWRPTGRRGRRQDQGAAPAQLRRARHPHHLGLAGIRCRAHRRQSAARRLCLCGRQSRLPQRHDAALRRCRRQARLAAHAGLVQQISARLGTLRVRSAVAHRETLPAPPGAIRAAQTFGADV